jgi:hypothetical protein
VHKCHYGEKLPSCGSFSGNSFAMDLAGTVVGIFQKRR